MPASGADTHLVPALLADDGAAAGHGHIDLPVSERDDAHRVAVSEIDAPNRHGDGTELREPVGNVLAFLAERQPNPGLDRQRRPEQQPGARELPEAARGDHRESFVVPRDAQTGRDGECEPEQ